MEVVIDSCIIINAIFEPTSNEDCFRILRFIFEGDVIPVVSEGLSKE